MERFVPELLSEYSLPVSSRGPFFQGFLPLFRFHVRQGLGELIEEKNSANSHGNAHEPTILMEILHVLCENLSESWESIINA